jgi:Family of unknown function (DUF5372)
MLLGTQTAPTAFLQPWRAMAALFAPRHGSWSRNTPTSSSTWHPFHPDRGRRMAIAHTRVDRGVEWIWYLDGGGAARQVMRAFTDLAEPDDFQRQAAGRCVFHMRDPRREAPQGEKCGSQ